MIKPMLASKIEDVNKLEFPLFASPKIDGIRALIIDNVVYSRSMKPIPNRHVQKLFGRAELNGLDGELIVGLPNAPDVYRKTSSGVMSEDGEPNVTFYTFDVFDQKGMPYNERRIQAATKSAKHESVVSLSEEVVLTVDELNEAEARWLALGYEGLMLRNNKPYKYGRASVKSGELLKLKRFEDGEAVIIGVEQMMSNQNTATVDVFGNTERSGHKAGMVPVEALGAVTVRGLGGRFDGVEFSVGSGFDGAERVALWKLHNDQGLAGKIIKCKWFPIGILDKPRFPTYEGFRDPLDMS